MRTLLEHSVQSYGTLPSEFRPCRSRTFSRPSPYPKNGSQVEIKETSTTQSFALYPSYLGCADTPGILSPCGGHWRFQDRVQGINPALLNPALVGSTARRALGWSTASGKSSTRQKENIVGNAIPLEMRPSNTDAKALGDGKSDGSNGGAVLLLSIYWRSLASSFLRRRVMAPRDEQAINWSNYVPHSRMAPEVYSAHDLALAHSGQTSEQHQQHTRAFQHHRGFGFTSNETNFNSHKALKLTQGAASQAPKRTSL